MTIEAGLQRFTFGDQSIDGSVDIESSCCGDVVACDDGGVVSVDMEPAGAPSSKSRDFAQTLCRLNRSA